MWGYLNRGEKRMPEIKTIEEVIKEDGKVITYAFPGGYPIYYLCEDGGILCPDCVNNNLELIKMAKEDNDSQWNVIALDVYYEGPVMYCGNCNAEIESAYGDPNEDMGMYDGYI